MSMLLDDVAPGACKLVELHVGALPSGTPIAVRAQILRSAQPGPVALLLGGLHGDEINGIETVRRVVSDGLHKRLQCGTVIAIPLLNVFGFLNYSRDVPDGKDVNRSFPGSSRGSLASRVAHAVMQQVLPVIDFGLDFHTGGRSHFNHPQTRFSPDDQQARVLAHAFGAPVSLASPMIAKSLRKAASSLGKPIVVFEGGENLRINKRSIQVAVAGIERVLAHQGMLLPTVPEAQEEFAPFTASRWTRAHRAGLFEWTKRSGDEVVKGETLGYIRDPFGADNEVVKSPLTGFILGHDNSPVISQGDALFHLAWRK